MASSTEHCGECTQGHPDHSKQLHRINRIIGQLEGVKRMIAERRYCPDILTQTRAISSALRSLEGSILELHLASCVKGAIESEEGYAEEKIEELVALFKKYR